MDFCFSFEEVSKIKYVGYFRHVSRSDFLQCQPLSVTIIIQTSQYDFLSCIIVFKFFPNKLVFNYCLKVTVSLLCNRPNLSFFAKKLFVNMKTENYITLIYFPYLLTIFMRQMFKPIMLPAQVKQSLESCVNCRLQTLK